MVNSIPVITIDGPSGSGKGTISQLLAHELQWHLLDSGALYRVLALAAVQHSIALDNALALEKLAMHIDVQFLTESLGQSARVILEGNDVTDTIRTSENGSRASAVASIPAVRTALFERQRAFREVPGLVADGRDMGSVIFPDAFFKVFLEASSEARAQRRFVQLQQKDISVSLDAVLAELVDRDKRDTERSVAPLKPAADAWLLDTTSLSIEQAFSRIMHEVKKRQ